MKVFYSESAFNFLHAHRKIDASKQLIFETKTIVCMVFSTDKSPWYYFLRKKILHCIWKINLFKTFSGSLEKSLHKIVISIFIKYFAKSTCLDKNESIKSLRQNSKNDGNFLKTRLWQVQRIYNLWFWMRLRGLIACARYSYFT